MRFIPFLSLCITLFFPPLFPLSFYYWGVYCPALIPPWVLLPLGLLDDFLKGEAFGKRAFFYLLFYGVLLMQRKHFFHKPFFVLWLGVGIFLLCFCFLIGPCSYEFFLVGLFSFPFLSAFFNRLYQNIGSRPVKGRGRRWWWGR